MKVGCQTSRLIGGTVFLSFTFLLSLYYTESVFLFLSLVSPFSSFVSLRKGIVPLRVQFRGGSLAVCFASPELGMCTIMMMIGYEGLLVTSWQSRFENLEILTPSSI